MSRKTKENSILSDRFYEKVFKIKLRGAQDIPTTGEFMKAIEQEYATKYLESLSIEPTKANIALILKVNPLEKCDLGASWNNGRVAETLTIIAREKKSKLPETKAQTPEVEEPKPEKKPSTLEAKLTEIHHTHKEETKGHDENKNGKDSSPKGKKFGPGSRFSNVLDEQENAPKEEEAKFQLNFDIESIKIKYLYPFNQSKQRKAYQNLVDDPATSYLPQIEKGATNDVLDPFKYYFPFSHVKVPSVILKELQTALKVSTTEISQELKKFTDSFPFDVFPHQKVKQDSEATISTFQTPPDSRVSERVPISVKERGVTFLKDIDLDKCKNILMTEEVARIVGVVAHLAYWQVFGHLNPIQPDLLTKKQMIVISIEQLNTLRRKVRNTKLWSLFIFPMIILTLKMMTEFILRNNYTSFFEVEKPCAIALEKVNLLISNMFDPNMLYSRFAFFESEIQAVNKKFSEHIDETRLRAKRIYGTNPYIDLYFPRPESDFVRNIRHKKNIGEKKKEKPQKRKEIEDENIDQENGEPSTNKEFLQQSYKVKMFQVLLDKIDDNGTADHRKKTGILNFNKEKV